MKEAAGHVGTKSAAQGINLPNNCGIDCQQDGTVDFGVLKHEHKHKSSLSNRRKVFDQHIVQNADTMIADQMSAKFKNVNAFLEWTISNPQISLPTAVSPMSA